MLRKGQGYPAQGPFEKVPEDMSILFPSSQQTIFEGSARENVHTLARFVEYLYFE
jgi:hypothetical protein